MRIMRVENNESYRLDKQEVSSKASLYFMLMNVYPRSNDSYDHEFLLEKLTRQYFPWKIKQYKN